jgi:hypothetical protein
MIDDIRICLLTFPSFIVSHVGKKASYAAHCLAQHALCLSFDLVWKEEGPSPILNIVMAEKLFSD